jgi:hypothetical protein
MPLRFCRVHVLHRLWGGQPCCRPAFRPAGPAEKRVRRLKSLPHGSDTTGLVGLRGCVASKKKPPAKTGGGTYQKKWFQVTRFPALPTADMRGIEHRN